MEQETARAALGYFECLRGLRERALLSKLGRI
jgi:hypothetical protein